MRIIGIDLGKISFKAVCLEDNNKIKEIFWKEHQQEIQKIWQELKEKWQLGKEDKIVVTGRLREMLPFTSIPERVAQEKAARFLYPNEEVTLIKLGGGGFSVLKIRDGKRSEFRQNPRCAVGVGSFLDQILSRVGLTITKVDQMVENAKGLEITSRCGITMKTDFTHLLNQGNRIEEVIAGLLDSSAKNAAALALKSAVTKKVLIIGGLSVSQRIVKTIKKSFNGIPVEIPTQALYFEALGAALAGMEKDLAQPVKIPVSPLVFLSGLKNYLPQVTKIYSKVQQESSQKSSSENLILGLDIGSTGSKLVILGKNPIFEAYVETKGQPVQAAKNLIQQIPAEYLNQIKAIGCTGSGREIVASLFQASLPKKNHNQIFVFNEIAAHARAALYYDTEVDTIVDIGGQDAKFTRLEKGRIIDFAMNTVCSAGTGSFLAEQLQLLGLKDVKQLGEIALDSPRAADLGQHCAVFISEQIDEAKRKRAKLEEIVAGLYYSIVLNYNNRVKGLRDYGKRIFLQGKPAENLALACALAKVTGYSIVVPASPGSMGALGIALLTEKEFGRELTNQPAFNFEKFLKSEVLEISEFICQSKDGCVQGNQCRVKVITIEQTGQKFKFFSGGACDKYEKRGKSMVLAQAPRPFLEREKLIEKLTAEVQNQRAKIVGIPRGLETEEILPLVITFFRELGFNIKFIETTGLKSLEQGAKLCQISFCAPLQVWAGEAKGLEDRDFIFLPKIIEIPGKKEEKRCYVCPLSQAAPDLFAPKLSAKVLQPFLNFKEGYRKNSREFLKLGSQLGCSLWRTWAAFKKAVKAQEEFEQELRQIGKRVLEFGRKNQIPVVVVLGHPYIINSSLFSAGISEVIQENGAIALPAECYPSEGIAPNLDNIYWGYGHRLLQTAFEIRRKPGVYPLWLSVYSCGPDSFLLHFFQYLSQDKPYTILESDAYTGQAGFKTRIEAFLYSIKNYQPKEKEEKNLPDLNRFETKGEILKAGEKRKVLISWMGEASKIMSTLLNGLGIKSETLPMADQKTLELGRKYTSGKECIPMINTLGTLFKFLENHPEGNFSYFMPGTNGPCRLGQYQLLTKIILEKLGLSERVQVISPTSETDSLLSDYFDGAMITKSWISVIFVDFLKDALLQTRPGEKNPGESERVFERHLRKTEDMVLKTSNDWSGLKKLWGIKQLAKEAAEEFKKILQTGKEKVTVLVTGEIYVRLDEFSNNFVIRELEALGAKVKLAPFREWINYTTFQRRKGLALPKQKLWKAYLTWFFQKRIEAQLYQIFAKALGWSKDHHIEEILKTAEPYLSKLQPFGESALTIGLPLMLWKKKEIDGVVLVGPFECMPIRIGETQLRLISEQTGLPVLSLSFHGDPLDKDLLESFVWDLKRR